MSIHAFGMLLNENFVHFPKFPMSTERLHRVFARYWRPDRRTVFLEKNLCFCSSRSPKAMNIAGAVARNSRFHHMTVFNTPIQITIVRSY